MRRGTRTRTDWAARSRKSRIRSCRRPGRPRPFGWNISLPPIQDSLDPGQHIAAGLLPVAAECLGRQIAVRHEFAIDIEDPARMDVVQQNVPAALAPGNANAIAHV